MLLDHKILPKLADADILEYNPGQKDVRYTGHDGLEHYLTRYALANKRRIDGAVFEILHLGIKRSRQAYFLSYYHARYALCILRRVPEGLLTRCA